MFHQFGEYKPKLKILIYCIQISSIIFTYLYLEFLYMSFGKKIFLYFDRYTL